MDNTNITKCKLLEVSTKTAEPTYYKEATRSIVKILNSTFKKV